MSDKDRGNLFAIVDASGKIFRFITGINDADSFFQDERTFDAVLLNFVVIGESVARLSEPIKKDNNHIPWKKIKAFRNFVVHDYFGVDAEEVWQIIINHLPKLEADIIKLLEMETK